MKNPTAILTGAYGAIGKAIAEGLAERGFQLVLVGRYEKELKDLVLELSRSTGNEYISHRAVDLSRKKEIEAFSQSWKGPLHLLMNNAVTAPENREETPDGVELQFDTNVLGYFWMMEFFHPHMENQEDARIVNVASYWAGDLDLDDLEFKKRPYDNDTAYRQSKQADRMLTAAFARRLKSRSIAVLAAHPGDVNSKVSRSLGYGGWEPPEKGAETPLFCATNPALKDVTGKYFEHKQEKSCRFAADEKAVERLYEICSKC